MKEAFYNIDLVEEEILEGNYKERQIYNTNSNIRAVLNSDLNYDNPPQDLVDSLILLKEYRYDDLEYLKWRKEWWVEYDKPAFITIGIVYDGMSDKIKEKTINYLIEEIKRNLRLQELSVWVQSSEKDEVIEQFLRPVRDFSATYYKKDPVEFDILRNEVIENCGGCSLSDLEGTDRRWHTLPCTFEFHRNIIIGNDGFFYRCIRYVGVPNQRVGTFDDDNLINKSKVHKKCKKCKWLPLCTGGCMCQKEEIEKGILCDNIKEWLKEKIKADK